MRKHTSKVAPPRSRGNSEGKSRSRSAGLARDTRFKKGNTAALKHGLARYKAKRTLTDDDIRSAVESWSASLVSDQGGASELTAIRGGYVRRLTDLEAMLHICAKDISSKGFFTAGGAARATVNTFMSLLDRWDKLASKLGMDRREKRVPSLEAFLQQEGNQE